jgi:outer membrane protein OmpA-like peptidoglycan-associated protein
LLSLLSLLWVPAWAAFESSPVGGRGAGVDGAMTAMADDVFALYDNPAGTVFLSKPELGTYLGRLYGGLTDNSNLSRSFLGYVHPFHGEAVGVSYNALNLTDLYKEETFGVSYAWKMGENFSLGVTGKRYRKSVGHDFNTENAELHGVAQLGVSDPVFLNGHAADAWGGDASAFYRLGNGWRTGFMIRNVNEANVALGSGDRDPVPRSWNWGLARQWNNHAVMLDATRERFTQMETRLHAGMETWVMGNHVGMRAGGGVGERDYRRVTAGFSYRLSLLQLDYGFMIPLGSIEGTMGTQQLSLILRLGTAPVNKPLLHPANDRETMLNLNDLLSYPVEFTSSTVKRAAQPESGEIIVSPAYVSLNPGQSQQFKTHVIGAPDGRVLWSLMPALGALSQSGIYQAPPEVLFPQDIWITARSEDNLMHYERAVVHLEPSTVGPVTVILTAAWGTGESDIRPANDSEIEKVAEIMRQYPPASALIKGYSDDRGSVEDKQRLSEKRAEAVRAQLIERFGIEPHRVIAQRYSASRPLASDPTAEDRRIDRQIEAVLSAPALPLAGVPDSDTNP